VLVLPEHLHDECTDCRGPSLAAASACPHLVRTQRALQTTGVSRLLGGHSSSAFHLLHT